ncbi:MAG: DUF4350 domain-containing protein, partial [Verrucomicrobiales bacterium]|nr:DUF4350 domain-containing protein [Verrucomicrobiales bacterium]
GLGVLMLLALLFGTMELFRLRFESGDTYPAYSTLRSDPKGCRAVYEALRKIRGEAVEQSLVPVSRLDDRGGLVLVRAGYVGSGIFGGEMAESEFLPMREVLEAGGKLVISLSSDGFRGGGSEDVLGVRTEGGEEAMVKLGDEWGLKFEMDDSRTMPDGGWDSEGEGYAGKVPKWLSRWWFSELDGAWEVLVRADAKPVVIRRAVGEGELVMASGSYFLSNEGLWVDAAPGLVEEVLKGRGRVVFDETHLGSVLNPGVVALIGRFRLQGAVVGAILVLLLYVWKNSSRLVPADALGEARLYADAAVMGAGATTGFQGLLRRNIGTEKLLSTCYREWFKSVARKSTFTRAKAEEVIALIEGEEAKPARQRRVVAVYNRVAELLNKRD